ncbi:MAG: hypothetical protein WA786_01520 [Acidimicrobiales bacterium]
MVWLIVPALLLGTALALGVTSADAKTRPRIASCAPSALRATLSTNATTFARSAPVRMKLTIKNVSAGTCAVAVGPTSPSLAIVNAKGSTVWNNCFADDQSGACAMFLMLHPLSAGAVYTLARSWNQRFGPAHKFVPRGDYVVTSSVSGLRAPKTVHVTLIN